MGGELEPKELRVSIRLANGTALHTIHCEDVFFVNTSTHSSVGRLCDDEEVGVLFVNPDHIATLKISEPSDAD